MISVRHLSKVFNDGDKPFSVLKDVNCEIEKGEVISIIGPSGTGKSTFLRCINRLETPTSGEIIIDGENILAKNANLPLLRRKMGMVFQSFNLFNHLNIMDNICVGPQKLLGMSRVEAEAQAINLLRMVGLVEKANSMPAELSGGQKQRIAIARCLSMKPEIILFDEPTSALDPTMVHEVLSVIRRLADEGMTMAIVTHEMSFARDVSSRIFFMYDGIIYEEGKPEVIFEHPEKEATRKFINRLRNLDFDINSRDFDLYGILGAITHHCKQYSIDPIRTKNGLQFIRLLLTDVLPFTGKIHLRIDLSERNHNFYGTITQCNYDKMILEDAAPGSPAAKARALLEKNVETNEGADHQLSIKVSGEEME